MTHRHEIEVSHTAIGRAGSAKEDEGGRSNRQVVGASVSSVATWSSGIHVARESWVGSICQSHCLKLCINCFCINCFVPFLSLFYQLNFTDWNRVCWFLRRIQECRNSREADGSRFRDQFAMYFQPIYSALCIPELAILPSKRDPGGRIFFSAVSSFTEP